MSRIRVGLLLPLFTADVHRVLGVAAEAEALGFDGVFGFDHLLPFGGGRPDGPALECFATLAAVGAVTSRVAVGSLVTRAALRPPGLLASQAATLDRITGGRVIVGVGAGDEGSDREHVMFGLPTPETKDRRALLGETATAVKSLLAGRAFPGGEHVAPLSGPLLPPPAREGGPPVWLGGLSSQVVRLAARVADGWNGWGVAIQRFEQLVKILDESSEGRPVEPTWAGIVLVGADRQDLQALISDREARGLPPAAVTGTAAEVAEHLRRFANAGATWVVVLLAGPADRRQVFAELVMPALA